MAETNIAYGSDQALVVQGAGLFTATMARLTKLNRLAGKLPTESDAENNLRFQSSSSLPVVRCMDLTKGPGDEIKFDLLNPMTGKPIMGDKNAQGLGAELTFAGDKLHIDQARFPISAGGAMSQQRTKYQLRKLARGQSFNLMARYEDQCQYVHLAGARGFHKDIDWVIPMAADADFASIMVNTVKAPTYNRHFLSNATGIEHVSAGSNDIALASTDILNMDVVDGLATMLEEMALAPPPVVFEDDQMSSDDPIRVLLVSPKQYNSFVQSTQNSISYRTLMANAVARGQMAKNHPLFMNDSLLWRGILLVKVPKPIRFYANDPINWCASATSASETTTDLVDSAFSTTYAVDRALLLGGMALAEAFGKSGHSGAPYFFEEEITDFKDKFEVVCGQIGGKSKIRLDINHGESTQPTDFGVIALDTAVKL